MTDLWPYSESSEMVPKRGIIWEDAAPGAFDAPPKVWRKVSQQDAQRLAKNAQYRAMFADLPADIQEVINAKAEGRAEVKPERKVTAPSPKSEKENILAMLESVLGKADDAGDLTAEIRAIELRAKLHALLTQKTTEEDRVVNIMVNTGVPRK